MTTRAPRKAPVFFRAAVGTVALVAAEADPAMPEKPKAREFTMSVYSGADMEMWFGKLAVDISGMGHAKGSFPSLVQHDPEKIAGYGESVDKGPKGQGPVTIKGKLLASSPHGRMVAEHSDEKFPWQASGGWRVSEYEEVEDGDTAEVNGREFTGPGLIARKSFLAEGSWVPLGADGNTSAIAAASGDAPEIEVTSRRKTMAVATLAELKAAFPEAEDREFVLVQREAEATIDQAKVAHGAILAERLKTERAARAADQKAAATPPKAPATPRLAVSVGPGTATAASAPTYAKTARQAYNELVNSPAVVAAAREASKAERRNVTPRSYVASEYPEIHEAYIRDANKGNPEAKGEWSHFEMQTSSGGFVAR